MSAYTRRDEIVERMKLRKFGTAEELAAEFCVSERTIRSDIQELVCQGYPIQSDTGRGGGIRWTGRKREFPFSEAELTALHRAAANASPEDRFILENLIKDRTPPTVEKNDI